MLRACNVVSLQGTAVIDEVLGKGVTVYAAKTPPAAELRALTDEIGCSSRGQ